MSVAVVHPEPSRNSEDDERIHSKEGIVLGQWDIGVFSCWDTCVPNCLMSCCCPCISLAQIYTRMGLLKYRTGLFCFGFLTCGTWLAQTLPHTQSAMDDPPFDNLPFVVMLIFHMGMIFSVWNARHQVRQRFQIDGDNFHDCYLSCCCSCCVVAQMATHVKSYTPGSCDFQAPQVLQAYQE